jgi:hypothetical protein
MGGSKRFLLPEETESRVRLVEAIPSDWGWVDGIIRFPSDQARFRQIAFDTGYAITRFNCSQPAIIGSAIKGSTVRRRPDLLGIMVENKLPGFVTFDMAGFGKREEFISVREIAASFVRRGYLGWLKFVKSDHRNGRDENPAHCEFRIGPNGDEKSEIVLCWEEKFGGEPKDIASILAVCYSANIKSAEPRSQRFT